MMYVQMDLYYTLYKLKCLFVMHLISLKLLPWPAMPMYVYTHTHTLLKITQQMCMIVTHITVRD